MKFPRFNLANKVTLVRLLFALICFVFLAMIQENTGVEGWRDTAAWIAATFFVISTATDALDGYLARRDNAVTAFGRIADPFVDKAIVCGGFIFLLGIPESAEIVRPWMVVVIVVREFLVNGIRGYMESVGIDFGAEMPGKIKMVVQSFAVGFLIGVVATDPSPPAWIHTTSYVLVWSTVVLTIWSGSLYVIKAARHLGPSEI